MTTLLGLNSGTSADGVDAVVVRFDGDMPTLPIEILANVHRDYPPRLREALETIFTEFNPPMDLLCALPYEIGDALATTASEALSQAGLSGRQIDVCGSHGQTIFHLPTPAARERALPVSTWQIGEASIIADRIHCPVASDFRSADIAAGGEGAPLTPILDHLLFVHPEKRRIRLNIGGIANLTWLRAAARGDQVVAFDTGPGNTLIDQTIRRLTKGKETYDRDGKRAASGTINTPLLNEMMADPYFALKPPKSTGRELFNAEWLTPHLSRANNLALNEDDLVATITALTPQSIVHAIENHLPKGSVPDELIVHGGGAKNPVIMEGLKQRLPAQTRITTVEEFGVPVQALEPLLFALLGWLCLQRRDVFYPGATGITRPAVLGKLSFPAP